MFSPYNPSLHFYFVYLSFTPFHKASVLSAIHFLNILLFVIHAFSFLKVNSDAEDDPNSAIAGMPVLKVLTLHSILNSIVFYVINTIQMISSIIIIIIIICVLWSLLSYYRDIMWFIMYHISKYQNAY